VAEGGLVVAGAVLVQAGGGVEVAPGVPEGVAGGQGGVGSAGAGGVAVRVVGVGDGDAAGFVDQAQDRAEAVGVVVALAGGPTGDGAAGQQGMAEGRAG